MNRLTFFALTIFGAALCAGCGSPCKMVDSTPVPYHGGLRDGNLYLSSKWDQTWLDFPASREYQIYHQLGAGLITPQPWVAFTAQPMPDNGTGNASLSPGNQSIIQAVNDQYVQVRNDTCEHFYLLMAVLRGDDDQAGAAGASN